MTQHGAQPRDDIKAPTRGDQSYIVILRGVVQWDLIEADSAYLARERACVRHHCEREHLQLGVMQSDMWLTKITIGEPLLKTSHTTAACNKRKKAKRRKAKRK